MTTPRFRHPRLNLALKIGALVGLLTGPGCGSGENPARPASQVVAGKTVASAVGSTAVARKTKTKEDTKLVPISESIERGPTLRVFPEAFKIPANAPGLQLQAIETGANGNIRDLTREVRWDVEPAGTASIDANGYLTPAGLKAAAMTVRATREGRSGTAAGNLENPGPPGWDFAEEIVPIFTKLGCNTGGCHGKADGQNGFHLSLFGYDPAGDYRAIARDVAQRRVSPIDPERSLLLTKATGTVPHGGGPRMARTSLEYRRIADWIAVGAPDVSGPTHGRVESVRVEPTTIRLDRPGPAQLRVIAHHADGFERDVTRQAIYRSLDDQAATVSDSGWVDLRARAETDLVVRYGSRVIAARISTAVNPDLKFDYSKLARRNLIDEELFKRLEALKVPVSPRSSDAAFLRRASLDITGEQPTPQVVREFIADPDPSKRSKLVDRLLDKPEFVLFWRIKVGDLLQISRARQGDSVYQYLDWIDHSLRDNRPWDDLVLTLLTALGDPRDVETGGPVNYALDSFDPKIQAEQTAQRFLGLRLRCAQCHDHPFDVWTQDDYYGFAAFFAKVQRGGMGQAMMGGRTTVAINPNGKVFHLRTSNPVQPTLLDRKPVEIAPKDDPRQALAAWMVSPDNPYFARAMTNWTWAQLFGKGIVDPPDDMSRANPPVHPELLDALAKHFVSHKFDLKDLIRTIATSEAYGLSSATVPGNERDSRLFSHHIPRPLSAHQMADALAQSTGVAERFNSGEQATRRKAGRRSIDLVDPLTPSLILDTFGRCDRSSSCASISVPPLSLGQSLLLIGGDVIESKIESLNGYLANALALEIEPEELVENLYYRTVCRPPNPEEVSRWAAELKQAPALTGAAEDLFWSLLNSREFAFNH